MWSKNAKNDILKVYYNEYTIYYIIINLWRQIKSESTNLIIIYFWNNEKIKIYIK